MNHLRTPSREGDLRSLQARLQQLQADLAAERAACEEALHQLARKDDLLAMIAHELRTPLVAILGWAYMLRRRSGRDEVDRGLDVIEQSAQIQAKLIEDLLVASRMSSSGTRLNIEPIDLSEVVKTAVESVRPALADKEIGLSVSDHGPVGPVRGDAMRLQQVLGNLLTNAVKFTPRGGRIAVSLGRSRGWAVIAVKDTGIGIAPQFLPHVFDRFRQDPSAARTHGGLGLGLAIARHLVELHGGEIEAESEGEGRGATFTVRLPLDEAPRA